MARRSYVRVLAALVLLSVAVYIFATLESLPGPDTRPVVPQADKAALDECEANVSRVLHQTWKTNVPPDWAKDFFASWDRVHGNRWTHYLHTDEDNRALMARVFPEHLQAYDSAPKNIVRVDMVRAAYLYDKGGVYADLDVEALKPLDSLLVEACRRRKPVILGRMDPPARREHPDSISNAIMASARPGEPFWRFCVGEWASNILRKDGRRAEDWAGPAALKRCLVKWGSQQGLATDAPGPSVWLLPPGVFYPHSWTRQSKIRECIGQGKDLRPDECKRKLDLSNAFTMTYWRHSWGR